MLLRDGKNQNAMVGPGLGLASMSVSQFGAIVAVPLMLVHGSFGISAMRLACAAILFWVLVRPKLASFNRAQWQGAIALGFAMATLTVCYLEAVTLIPVGPAITIDFLGPLTVAIIALRGWPRYALPLLAGTGVLAMTYSRNGLLLDPAGLGFACASACAWGIYIVLMRHVGRLFVKLEGLCLSFMFAAIFALTAVYFFEPSQLSLRLLPIAAGLALLSPLLPFSLEMMALRRMEIGAFSILMSLEPAIGAVLGFLILRQGLSARQIFGVMAVMLASFIAVMLSAGKTSAKPAPVKAAEPAATFCDVHI